MKYIIAITLIIVVFGILIMCMNYKEDFSNKRDLYIVDIATGANHSVFLTKKGKVHMCGKNVNGRLGTGNSASVTLPVSLHNSINIRKLFAGNVNTFLLTNDNFLYATGENSEGQLGIGNLDNQFAPVSIPFFKSQNIQISKVAAGWYHTLFLTTSNDVYVCGSNKYGQLANGTNVATNVPVKLLIKCIDIAAGQGHSIFLSTDYNVYTAGWNWYGQLGNNTVRNSKQPFLINTGGNIRKVYAGMSYTLLLNNTGRVFVCGDNTNGQIGLSRNITNQRSFALIEHLPSGITDISASQSHTFFLGNTGHLYSVGSNVKGQLGIGNNTTIYKPEKVKFFNGNVLKVATGANHSLFITKEDGVYACGDNTMGGQLGIKNITETNVPRLCDIEIEKINTGMLYKTDIVGVV